MTTEGNLEVIIADDHPLIREGVRHMLEKSPGIKVVGEASNGQEAVDLVQKMAPDVLLLDLEMPVLDGFEVLDILMKRKAKVLVLMITAHNDPAYVEEAMNRGAWGFFCKEDAPKQLVKALLKARTNKVLE